MENIGTIIREHRLQKGMTQEELGNELFLTKQAVSKWETGRTMPDIETVRKLCQILDISKEEILGGSIEATRKSYGWVKIFAAISAGCIVLTIVALFFLFDVPGFIDRRTQSGVAYIAVFQDGDPLPTSRYQISGLQAEDLAYGYGAKVGYGELRGNIRYQGSDIQFGCINTNDWHNIQIRLDIHQSGDQLTVTQTVTFKTGDDRYQVLVTTQTTTGEKISVFRPGV